MFTHQMLAARQYIVYSSIRLFQYVYINNNIIVNGKRSLDAIFEFDG